MNFIEQEIRRAFKKIALEKHPDKNPNDPGAHDEFVRINRAFEVLKDKDLRKKYAHCPSIYLPTADCISDICVLAGVFIVWSVYLERFFVAIFLCHSATPVPLVWRFLSRRVIVGDMHTTRDG